MFTVFIGSVVSLDTSAMTRDTCEIDHLSSRQLPQCISVSLKWPLKLLGYPSRCGFASRGHLLPVSLLQLEGGRRVRSERQLPVLPKKKSSPVFVFSTLNRPLVTIREPSVIHSCASSGLSSILCPMIPIHDFNFE